MAAVRPCLVRVAGGQGNTSVVRPRRLGAGSGLLDGVGGVLPGNLVLRESGESPGASVRMSFRKTDDVDPGFIRDRSGREQRRPVLPTGPVHSGPASPVTATCPPSAWLRAEGLAPHGPQTPVERRTPVHPSGPGPRPRGSTRPHSTGPAPGPVRPWRQRRDDPRRPRRPAGPADFR